MDDDLINLLLEEGIIKDREKYLEEINNNPELKGFNNIISALSKLGTKNHIDSEMLSEYILYLNGDSSDRKKFQFLSSKIEDHLLDCDDCRSEYEFLKSEFYEVDHFIKKSITDENNKSFETYDSKPISIANYLTKFRYLYAVAASIAVLFIFLVSYSELSTPKHIQIVNSKSEFDFSSTRGRNTENFITAVNYLEQNDYEPAIELLKKDLVHGENKVTDFYTHYILGLTHLANSRSDFLGFFNQYDNSELQNAIEQFLTTLELNKSGMFETINSNTYFHLGECYLLSKEFTKAKNYLTKAIELKSEYSSLADEILSAIE
jgi:tetratricopeptide (TPR) repeat protein